MAPFRSQRGGKKPYPRPASRPDVDSQWIHDKAPTGPKGDINNNNLGRSKPPAITASLNSKLVVSNLHYEITPKDLTTIFGQMGTLVREPLIRYDRSGRSSGTAIISFETEAEATRAKRQFDGILAKGQPMSIAYDTMPLRSAHRTTSVPSSLLNRIQKPPLLDRLTRNDNSAKKPTAPRGGLGPTRTRPVRGTGAGSKKPKTAEELDQELDAFMGDAAPTPGVETVREQAAQPDTVAVQDVEMV